MKMNTKLKGSALWSTAAWAMLALSAQLAAAAEITVVSGAVGNAVENFAVLVKP
jgi:hypothetical protein